MKKILITIGLVLIIIIGYFIIGFYGNPVSKALGIVQSKKFVENEIGKEYVYLDSDYSFKTKLHYNRFSIPGSLDKNFTVETNTFGKVMTDVETIENNMELNTFIRFENELRKVSDPIIEKNFEPSKLSYGYISSDSENYKEIKLDEEYSLEKIPRPLEINLAIIDSEITFKNLAKLFLKVEQILLENNFKVEIYSLGIIDKNPEETPYNSVNSFDVPYEEFIKHKNSEEELSKFLEQHSKKWDEENKK